MVALSNRFCGVEDEDDTAGGWRESIVAGLAGVQGFTGRGDL